MSAKNLVRLIVLPATAALTFATTNFDKIQHMVEASVPWFQVISLTVTAANNGLQVAERLNKKDESKPD
jgi:hypothetical protein